MFKRANKITALLVAAASVMTVVPAMAADRLATKDGTIETGYAFDGGKYIYNGYRTDDDNTGIYYNGGDKDKLVDDALENYDVVGKYGKNYLLAQKDNNDEYLVDLTTGKLDENITDQERRDNVEGSLRATLKRTDRYSGTDKFEDVKVGERLFQNNKQFGDVWYKYSANGDTAYTATTTSEAVGAKVTVTLPTVGNITDLAVGKTVEVGGVTYTRVADGELTATDATNKKFNTVATLAAAVKENAPATLKSLTGLTFTAGTLSGNEVTYTATETTKLTNAEIRDVEEDFGANCVVNAEAKTTTSDYHQYFGFVNEDGKYIDASNLGNIYVYSKAANKVIKVEQYDDYDEDDKIIVEIKDINAVAQDKDYIYAITEVTVGQADNKDDAKTAANSSSATTRYFYQKIAKAQGDKKDDAYIPKTVDSYEIDNKSFYDDGDANDAYKAILTDDDGYLAADNMYTVKDGTLYVVRVKSDKVKVFKMKTKKAKVDPVDSIIDTATDKTKQVAEDKKLDAPLVQKDADGDHDIFEGAGSKAVSIDVDGNVWTLDKGTIYKVDGKDFKEMFTLDRSIDNLDVYNDGSLIAWENNGDAKGKVYTTVTEGKAAAQEEAKTEVPAVTPAKTGWDKLADGTWNLYDSTGAKVASKWMQVGAAWYAFDANGTMKTGWFKDTDGTWYYLNKATDGTEGAMKTGWFKDTDGTWYFLKSSGAMAANETTPDGYYVNASGAWV